MRFRQYRNTLFSNESTQMKNYSINTHCIENPTTKERRIKRPKNNNPSNPQTNPKHLYKMSSVRSSKIPPPRTRKSLNDRRQRKVESQFHPSIPCYKVLGDLGPETHEGMLFLLYSDTCYSPSIFGLVCFWFSFFWVSGSLTGCEVWFHFWLVKSREDFTELDPTCPMCL